jgi:hypothetical protein
VREEGRGVSLDVVISATSDGAQGIRFVMVADWENRKLIVKDPSFSCSRKRSISCETPRHPGPECVVKVLS